MEVKALKRVSGKKIVALLLMVMTMLFFITPVLHAEGSTSINVRRFEGLNREHVAELVAEEHFSNSNKVILVNRNKFPDAISATNISQGQYPVLYTREGYVNQETIETLQAMPLNEIYILGGKSSINDSVAKQLKDATGVKVTRISGENRYVANSNAVRANFKQNNHVVIASGEVYADALYGVSYANTIDAPVILTRQNRLESSTINLLKELKVNRVTIIGGPVTVTTAVEDQLNQLGISHQRIAGKNRYIGSAEVAAASYNNPENVIIASGEVFSDALVSAPLAQKLNAPILLVRKNRMENSVETYLLNNATSINNIYIQGGHLTIQNSLMNPILERVQDQKEKELITTLEVEQNFPIKYEVKFVLDKSLKKGEHRVEQEGKEGQLTRTYLQTLQHGNILSEEILKEQVKFNPVHQIVHIGVEETGLVDIEFDKNVFNQEVLKLVNEERIRVGVPQLYYEPELQRGVDIRTLDSVSIQTLRDNHSRPDDSEWYTAFNYLESSPVFAVGENIAYNTLSIQDAQEDDALEKSLAEIFYKQYADSPGHYQNMIYSTHDGMAVSTLFANHNNSKYSMRIYNTMVFSNRY